MREFEARVKAEEERLEREHEAQVKAEEERQMRKRIAWRQEHEREVSVWRAEFRRQQEDFFKVQEQRWQGLQQASSSRHRHQR